MTFPVNSAPVARYQQLVIQELADEVLIYDLENNNALCLNHTAAFVWQSCDGQNTVSQIAYLLAKKLKTPVAETVVWFALETLQQKNLLSTKIDIPFNVKGMSRRQLIHTLGKASAVAIPILFAITVPTTADAQSVATAYRTDGQTCSAGSPCCSGLVCSGGFCAASGGGCVLYDTPITTANGETVRARDIVVGQGLLGVNCINGETIAGRVKHVVEKSAQGIYSVIAENGAIVNCSGSHDLIEGFGDTKGKRAEQFCEGDALLVFDTQSKKIVETKTAAINKTEIYQPVLMFEMDTAEHTFISGGILSHNVSKA